MLGPRHIVADGQLVSFAQISRLEATRDLTQKIVHVDMDAFVSLCRLVLAIG